MYTEKDVHNKIDSILRKGKQFYSTYRRTGKRLTYFVLCSRLILDLEENEEVAIERYFKHLCVAHDHNYGLLGMLNEEH